jgi:uncharacterized repeat protein (TIGR03803 family)
MKTNIALLNRAGPWFGAGLRAAASCAALLLFSTPGSGVERQVLPGHVPKAVARLGLRPVGRLPATNRLSLAIGLPLRNTNALNQLLQDMYDPASPQFRHYLTPEQFTERFGPSKQDYEAVMQFARRQGLEITATHSNRVLLDVAGPVADIEKAFQVTLHTYQHPTEARQFYAPDVEPSVAAGLAVLDISGLNTFALPRPVSHRTSVTGAAHVCSGSGPSGNYMGKDFRNAYAPGVTLTGAGQMVGLVEFEGFYPSDITAYKAMADLPNVPIQVVLLDGFNGVPVAGDGDVFEVEVDIDMVISMAPGLSKVVVFEAGPNRGYHLNDILNAMAANPQIKQFACCWNGFPQSATSDQIFQQMVAQGQSFFMGASDADSLFNNVYNELWGSTPNGGYWPSDDPYVTSVGGTSLTMNGSGASYASEKVWNEGYEPPGFAGCGYLGSSGGSSPVYPIPSWQQGLDMSANRGSTTMRNIPDVAMVAENFVVVWEGSESTGQSGTSFATPLWAAFTALVNQEAAANSEPPVGFLNPALYALGQSADYTNYFHDITVGNNATSTSGGLYPAVPGYDLCTGWGTPKGSNLIYALALPESLGIAPNSNLVFSGPVGGPLNPGALSYSLTNRNGSLDWSLAVDADWLTVAPTNGTLLAGGTNTVITLTPNLLAINPAAGSYTATLYFTNLLDQSVQRRYITLAVFDAPLITSQPTNQSLLEGMTATFSVGTATNALLYYQWQFDSGSGPTNLTNGGGISGSATSALTINNVSPANAGAYSVIVSNAAGSVTSGSASLTIITGQAPAIVSAPASQTILPGATATFTVSGAGDAPLSYFWQLNGTNLAAGGNLSGSATSTLTIRSATVANCGGYSVLITNSYGSVTSTVAVLSLISGVTSPGVALETLYSFTTNAVGYLPFGGLIQANNGSFYGTTSYSGGEGLGTVFQMNANGVVTPLYSFFQNDSDGSHPIAALVQGTNGLLYGTAAAGGDANGDGTVFRISTNGAGTVGWSLSSASSGSVPYGGLVQGQDGNFYGTSLWGGAYGNGMVFRLTAGGSLTGIQSLTKTDGANPACTLVQGADGNFYGTAQNGGTNGGWGTIFKVTPTGLLTSLLSFANTNGALPVAGLTQDGHGTFYGTTYAGGAYGAGTVFKLAADGTFTSLYSFTGGNDGSNCYGGLLLASDGKLYGTTVNGGVYGLGTVFRITSDGTLATLVQFDGYQGANPRCTLMQGADGRLYGTTPNGGANYSGAPDLDIGSIFRLTLPMFLRNPFTQASATATMPYSASLSTNAVTPAGDVLTFAKVSGPAWLSVATAGTLSGTPAGADIGANVFTVSLADTNGWSSTATMSITVVPLPSISLSTQGTNMVLSWSGGQPPYSVQMATDLAGATWQTIAGPMTNTTTLVIPTNTAAFYRVGVGN